MANAPQSCHLYINDAGNAFDQALKAEAQSVALELTREGFPIFVDISFAQGDAREQQRQIESDRASGHPPDLFVVIPVDQGTIYPIVSEIARGQDNATCVILQQPLTAMLRSERESYKERLFSVVTDQAEIGRLQARQFTALLAEGRGDILYVQGAEHSYATHQRMKGMVEELPPGVKLSGRRVFGDWTPGSVNGAIEGWKSLGGRLEWIQAAGAQSDDMAIALADYVKAAGSQIPVIGVDGLALGRSAVDAGVLAATVIQPTGVGTALRAFWDLARGVPGQSLISDDGNIVLMPESYPPLDDLKPKTATPSNRAVL
jgi:ABC-type sugar transport system substrate-binding protein